MTRSRRGRNALRPSAEARLSLSGVNYDAHAPCRQAMERQRSRMAESLRIREVVLQVDTGFSDDKAYKVLQILRVDPFEDGLRILVR